MWNSEKNPAIMCEIVSLAAPGVPPTKEKIGMMALMPMPSTMLETNASTMINKICQM